MTANKRRAIRNTLDRLGMQAKPEQVVADLESHGLEVSDRFVSLVRIQMLRSRISQKRLGKTARISSRDLRRRSRPSRLAAQGANRDSVRSR